MVALEIVAHGKAAHSGNHHEDGANAIWALARWLDRARSLGPIRVTAARGGTSRNTVPAEAHATIEVPEELVSSLESLESEVSETRIEVVLSSASPEG